MGRPCVALAAAADLAVGASSRGTAGSGGRSSSMAKRRMRRRFTWFPVIGTAGPGEPPDNFNQRLFALNVQGPGGSITTVAITPVVPDVPMEGDEINVDAPGQLVQAIGQEYYIERIVGKLFLSLSGPQDDPPGTIFPKIALVGAGFFVARANDADSGGGPNTPIGSASPAERAANYSPLSPDPIREPWMWRRVWILTTGRPTNPGAVAPNPFGFVFDTTVGVEHIPPNVTNLQMSSALDGPHFDVKTVRRVGNDERLYFVVAVRQLDSEFVGQTGAAAPTASLTPDLGTGGLFGVLDFRVLGRLTRAKNKSNF